MQQLLDHTSVCTLVYSGNKVGAINLFKENLHTLQLTANFTECKLFVITLNYSIYNYILLKENISLHKCCLNNNNCISNTFDVYSLEKIGIFILNSYHACHDYLIERIGHPDIKKAVQYIHTHLNEPVTLEEVSSVINLNKSYFCTLFKEHTGFTFTQYLNLSRVKIAKQLILQNTLDLNDIAYRCGFNSYTYFCSTFKKFTGSSPSEIK